MDLSDYVSVQGIKVADALYKFIENEVMPESGISTTAFWRGLANVAERFATKNRALLAERTRLQTEIDAWHKGRKCGQINAAEYRAFLEEIGYLLPEGPDFRIDPPRLDTEIASVPGPQLVVPITNSRYALNAVNARWGSLYDALYGSDAIAGEAPHVHAGYDADRGERVIDWARQFLDEAVPLTAGSHADARLYAVNVGELEVLLFNGRSVRLKDPLQLRGYRGSAHQPAALLFANNGLHIEVAFDPSHPVGREDPAGMSDVILESAITTILDLEDSVAVVDPSEKVSAYRNWLQLCGRSLVATFDKNGASVTRRLAPDRTYKSPQHHAITLPGRSLMLIRNVGHLMTDHSIIMRDGQPIPEGVLDAVVTSLISLHDLKRSHSDRNSRAGSIYIVKPKMHGPHEVAFTNELFSAVEDLLDLPRNTIKLGLMDEERRTTVNLKECIRAAKSRIFFINTGFLDRTGDEIRVCLEAGPVVRKGDMKSQKWFNAYEEWNVDIGLACGFSGRAQIGKGMWAMPDLMSAMLVEKIAHPKAGANTAWVPSPTAATLHSVHYHKINVLDEQKLLSSRPRRPLEEILTVPVVPRVEWSREDIQRELDNNTQSILGYVVRWVNEGIGCSKVPDVNNIGLMEDRATLRISSQQLANWLHHGVISEAQALSALKRMAAVVDKQNADNTAYRPMATNFDTSVAFATACDLIFKAAEQPNGYTEPILHSRRIEFKNHESQFIRRATSAP